MLLDSLHVDPSLDVANLTENNPISYFHCSKNDGDSHPTSILTRTGMIDPVIKGNGRCPITRSIDAIAPEWLVKDMNVLPSS